MGIVSIDDIVRYGNSIATLNKGVNAWLKYLVANDAWLDYLVANGFDKRAVFKTEYRCPRCAWSSNWHSFFQRPARTWYGKKFKEYLSFYTCGKRSCGVHFGVITECTDRAVPRGQKWQLKRQRRS